MFLSGQPEWTPNVQYYSSSEYLRVDHATRCNIRGTLAVPVFLQSGSFVLGGAPSARGGAPSRGPGGASGGALVQAGGAPGCVAVLEMVMLEEDVRFKQQLDSICQALQMVNLASKPGGGLGTPEVGRTVLSARGRTTRRGASLTDLCQALAVLSWLVGVGVK